jgi:hypothetical protein
VVGRREAWFFIGAIIRDASDLIIFAKAIIGRTWKTLVALEADEARRTRTQNFHRNGSPIFDGDGSHMLVVGTLSIDSLLNSV